MKYTILALTTLLFTACSSSPTNESLTLIQPRLGHAVVADGNSLYVIDGSTRLNRYLGSIEKIDLESRQVSPLGTKLFTRRYVSAVNDGKGNIYVMGGVSRFKSQGLTTNPLVEIYNPIKDQVLYSAPMPNPRRAASAVRMGSKIYVIGGSVVYEKPTAYVAPSAKVDVLDIDTQTWTKAADMRLAAETKAVVYQGKIYVVGGYNYVDSLPLFASYDPKTDKWTELPSLPQKLSAQATIVVDNKLITFGDYSLVKRVQSYDFSTGKWTTRNDVPFRQSRHQGIAKIDGDIVVAGGTTTGNDEIDDIQIFPVSSFTDK